MIKFRSFSSGSAGNCYFLGIEGENGKIEAGILIDAGVSMRTVRQYLEQDGYSLNDIDAMLISHEHWDHVKSLGTYCKRLKVPVWASETLARALTFRPGVGDHFPEVRRELPPGWFDIVPGRIKVRAFIVPHDAKETLGYAIMLDDYKFVIMTDTGRVTSEALSLASQADTVVIESNYDPDMLRHGPYPPDLQERIRGGHGHLSNQECAQAIESFRHDGLRSIFLCHLSEHNNTPQLALEACRAAAGNVRLTALPRTSPSPLFSLE